MSKRTRFQEPPAANPMDAAKSSLTFRLTSNFFLRQVGIFLAMDILLALLCMGGLFLYAENRCANVAALVDVRGIPTADATVWMEASDYSITALDREPEGMELLDIPFMPGRAALEGALHSYDLAHYYVVEIPNDGTPYAIRVELRGIFRILYWAAIALLVCQGLSLLSSLLRNNRTINRALRPIQDLAATAARLSSMAHMSRQELEALADELEKINAKHLDSRIDLPGTQKELRSVAEAINSMLDRVNGAYSAQMQFISDASHELRTPIAVIQGYAALMDRWGKEDPAALQEAIDAIRSEAKSMEELVEQLLFLARGDNDTQPVKCVPFDLLLLAGDVLREEEMIHADRLFLPRWGEEPIFVNADDGLIKQVMRVLMDNSVKYSAPNSKVYLRVSAHDGYARVTVQDEGMGISPDGLTHIFDRFYRTDQSRDRKTGGTGLGLSIAKWIIDRHGGWFEIVSREGVGSRFTFLLPLYQPEDAGLCPDPPAF